MRGMLRQIFIGNLLCTQRAARKLRRKLAIEHGLLLDGVTSPLATYRASTRSPSHRRSFARSAQLPVLDERGKPRVPRAWCCTRAASDAGRAQGVGDARSQQRSPERAMPQCATPYRFGIF